MALDDVERGHIQHVLEVCDWNQTRAAKALGIDRVTLYNKIKKYGFRKADRRRRNENHLPAADWTS